MPTRLSRSKVVPFIECQLCFWLSQKIKIKHPSAALFSLNIAINHLLKNKFNSLQNHAVLEYIKTNKNWIKRYV